MFNLFKRKQPKTMESRVPRGVLPTFVTDDAVILCKISPKVRNAYELRLMLYMATQHGKPFVLSVSPGADVAEDLRTLLSEHNGTIQEMTTDIYSIYVGHLDMQGAEGDGWVLGDSDTWKPFLNSLRSQWLKDRLVPGASFSGDALVRLQQELEPEAISQVNIDEENVKVALLDLIAAAREQGGEVFIQ